MCCLIDLNWFGSNPVVFLATIFSGFGRSMAGAKQIGKGCKIVVREWLQVWFKVSVGECDDLEFSDLSPWLHVDFAVLLR